jgi:hypothetical protein
LNTSTCIRKLSFGVTVASEGEMPVACAYTLVFQGKHAGNRWKVKKWGGRPQSRQGARQGNGK